MKTIFALTMWLACPGFGQNAAPTPDPIQTLLVEVRLLREDVEAVTVASQRVQIALYSLQLQDAAVAREGQRLDAARAKCSAAAENGRHTVSRASQLEDILGKVGPSAPETKDLTAELTEMKRRVSDQDAELQACRGDEAERMNQFQKEQTRMRELRDRIEALDQALQRFTPAAK